MMNNQYNFVVCSMAIAAFSMQAPPISATAFQFDIRNNNACIPNYYKVNNRNNIGVMQKNMGQFSALMTVNDNVDHANIYIKPEKTMIRIKAKFKIVSKKNYRIAID